MLIHVLHTGWNLKVTPADVKAHSAWHIQYQRVLMSQRAHSRTVNEHVGSIDATPERMSVPHEDTKKRRGRVKPIYLSFKKKSSRLRLNI